ncbi:cell division protein FtsQ/DivIB [Paracoccus benzoatiresistens]|uniref:Cell division protein FtsQ n=1 Tax=Paracoccus benzoatiresistens TaxID=2997341 RepID=A0ABT4J462_9RHOB|nr:cell division protein FtsQ/DivIB [Paracoccus sp. EF6]MCZ0961912.1 cell division protein FtsQ/DivIB [Paracoccus sp. EF6]
MPDVIDHRPNRQPQPDRIKRDPAPSRLQYRLERMWLRPIWRRAVRVGVPAFLVAMTAGIWLSDEDRRAQLSDGVQHVLDKVQSREEFLVRTMVIEGVSPVVDEALRKMLPVDLPASSFDIDLTALRLQVMQLDVIESVDLRIKPGGILSAVVKEREPAVLWRHARGIEILDRTGHRVASVTSRDVRADLPLIAGEGADLAVPEALSLIDAAGPILPRVRGLVRKGERRWDLELDHGQKIMLPAEDAVIALQAAIALDRAQDLLGRDITAVDLRNPSQPALRLGIDARNTIREARGQALLGPDGKVIIPEDDKKGG